MNSVCGMKPGGRIVNGENAQPFEFPWYEIFLLPHPQ